MAPPARPRTARPRHSHRARTHAGARPRDGGRDSRRAPRVPHAEQRQAGGHRPRGGPVGRGQRDELVDGRAAAGHRARRDILRRLRTHRRRGLRVPPRSEQVGAGLPRDRGRRRDRAHQHDQGDPGPRAPRVQPDRRDTRAVVPERPLGAGGRLLRGCSTGSRTQAIAEDASAARGRRGRDRRRCGVQPGAPRRPLDVGRHRRARLRLGLVRHVRDRLRRALPRPRCAGRAGSRDRRGTRRRRERRSRRPPVRRRRAGSATGRAGDAVSARPPAASRAGA